MNLACLNHLDSHLSMNSRELAALVHVSHKTVKRHFAVLCNNVEGQEACDYAEIVAGKNGEAKVSYRIFHADVLALLKGYGSEATMRVITRFREIRIGFLEEMYDRNEPMLQMANEAQRKMLDMIKDIKVEILNEKTRAAGKAAVDSMTADVEKAVAESEPTSPPTSPAPGFVGIAVVTSDKTTL